MAMVDLEGTTLAPFSQCDRLLWPVADTETDAAAILRGLINELVSGAKLPVGVPYLRRTVVKDMEASSNAT
jgi:hypothetical protein